MTKIFYLTKEGLKKIEDEYEELKRFQKEKSGEAPAMMEGDALNPDYSSYKENVETLSARLEELDNVLKNYKIIKKPEKSERNTVQIGAKVVLKGSAPQKEEFKIVGTLEANPFEGRISNESPVGQAFMGRQVGEVVNINDRVNYKILKIEYEES
jgi:transcription elongation factor GreA